MIIKWEDATKTVEIYADGKKVGNRAYHLGGRFYGPTGMPYMIGNDGHRDNHQFHGSVMDLYIFGTALSLDKINKLRGLEILITLTNEYLTAAFLGYVDTPHFLKEPIRTLRSPVTCLERWPE